VLVCTGGVSKGPVDSLKVPEGIKGASLAQGDFNDPVSGSRPKGRGICVILASGECIFH
jgi:hypothetical protein